MNILVGADVRRSKQLPVNPPPRWLVTLVTWLAIYPLLTGLLWLFRPGLSQLPLPLQTLPVTMILVPLMTYVMMPRLMALLQIIRSRAPT